MTSRIIRTGRHLDYGRIGREMLAERAGMVQAVSGLLARYRTTGKRPSFSYDNEFLVREESLPGVPDQEAYAHKIFFRGEVLACEYGLHTLMERILTFHSVHREHEAMQYIHVVKGASELKGLDLASLDLIGDDLGTPLLELLAIHYKGQPVFLATQALATTTMFFEPQVSLNLGFDQPWVDALDNAWQDYTDLNPLKTHEDFRRKHGYP